MGNSQIGTAVKDWDSQNFAEHLQFKVFVERLDSLLDATKIDNIKFVKMDLGWIVKGLNAWLSTDLGMLL